jgi:hypothetical protein
LLRLSTSIAPEKLDEAEAALRLPCWMWRRTTIRILALGSATLQAERGRCEESGSAERAVVDDRAATALRASIRWAMQLAALKRHQESRRRV